MSEPQERTRTKAPGTRHVHLCVRNLFLFFGKYQMSKDVIQDFRKKLFAKSRRSQWRKENMSHLVCDCGPHFRSRECVAFFLYNNLVHNWKVDVSLRFLGEQHGKGLVDRLFGWTCAWIEGYLQQQPVYALQNLLACYKAGAQDMANRPWRTKIPCCYVQS